MAKKLETEKKKKAVIMVRRSKKNRERMESIPNQIAFIKGYAEHNGYEVVAIYQDDGKTGTNAKRPGLQKMLDDAQTGIFQYVLVWKLDRISRNVRLGIEIEEELLKYGVQIISVTEYVNDGSVSAKMAKLYASVNNEIAIDILRENTMRGLLGNAKDSKTCGGRPPLGYVLDKKKYKVDPFAAEAVRQAYAMYARGESKTAIAETLNKEGYRTNTGGKFVKTSFDRIFTNPKYVGVFTYSEIVRNENTVPAIIDNATFAKVQARLAESREGQNVSVPRNKYALSGLVRCASCGRIMNVDKTRTGKTKTEYITFFCPGKKKFKDCDTKPVNINYINEYLIYLINRHISESFDTVKAGIEGILGKLNAAEKKEQWRIQQELGKIKEAVRRLTHHIGEEENDDVTEEIKVEISERKAQMRTLEAKLEALADKEKPNITDKRLKYLLAALGKTLIANGTNLAEKRVLHTLVEGITLNNSEIVVTLNLP